MTGVGTGIRTQALAGAYALCAVGIQLQGVEQQLQTVAAHFLIKETQAKPGARAQAHLRHRALNCGAEVVVSTRLLVGL
jgi:hypothetical protein